MTLNNAWVGVALVFLGVLWVGVFVLGEDSSLEERVWERETYSSGVRGAAGFSCLVIVFFPAFLLWRRGFCIIEKSLSAAVN